MISRTVLSSGWFLTTLGETHQPSPKPVIGPGFATKSLFSSFAFESGPCTALLQSSGAISGIPFSFIDVKVGIVAPATNSTSQSYPFSKIILSTFAISSAEAQFISAIVTLPQAVCSIFFSAVIK